MIRVARITFLLFFLFLWFWATNVFAEDAGGCRKGVVSQADQAGRTHFDGDRKLTDARNGEISARNLIMNRFIDWLVLNAGHWINKLLTSEQDMPIQDTGTLYGPPPDDFRNHGGGLIDDIGAAKKDKPWPEEN